MDHSRTVRAEFSRQAQAFARSETLGAPEVTLRIAEALGDGETERILDLACGPGVLTPTLSPKARHVVGLDLTEETLRLARERALSFSNALFVRAVAERAPFAERCFDAAVLRLALHHFEHPGRALAELRRLLRPAGRLVVLDILTAPEPEVAELHNAIERLRDPSHTALLPRDGLRKLINGAGFSVISETCWEGARDFAGWARIISEPRRMSSLELVLRHLARAGVTAGIDLREENGEVCFTYRWGLFVAEAATA